ncbi:MAG: hypothetical protein FJ279_12675, partial [Planctomycetes bacterium]|nr:hypothetical protein [Planctomycetota bacterium]
MTIPPQSCLALFSVLLLGVLSGLADAVEWTFDSPSEVVSTVNIEHGRVANGRLSGWTAWDPHFSLRVPKEGLDAAQLTWLTVRMYSSAEADVLDVYYGSPDGRWCLGGKLPIRRGWATYRLDLTKNHWRETRASADSKQWGGPSKRVNSFRLDPGNQENRYIMMDSVKLEPASLDASLRVESLRPELVEGIMAEPRGTAMLNKLTAPKKVEAGEKLSVSAELEVSAPEGLAKGTAFVRLRHGAAAMSLTELPVALGQKTLKVAADLPISAYWYPGALTVEIGCYELDMAQDSPPAVAEIGLTNKRVGTVKPPVCELRPLGGDAAIFVGRVCECAGARVCQCTRLLAHRLTGSLYDARPMPGFMYLAAAGLHLDYHREVADQGIHLYSDWFGTSRHSDMGHIAPDKYDYGEYDRYFAAILDVDPHAYFLPHIGVTGPLWWQKAHPEEMSLREDGVREPTSFASEAWKREMGADLRKLLAYLRRAPYADRIIGYIFYSGYTAEWQMWDTWQPSRDDYSAPALRAFRAFLKNRYATDERLQAAWNDAKVTLATAEMPRWDKRRPPGPQVLRDPKTERQAMDFYEFISHMDADALLHFARITREATG